LGGPIINSAHSSIKARCVGVGVDYQRHGSGFASRLLGPIEQRLSGTVAKHGRFNKQLVEFGNFPFHRDLGHRDNSLLDLSDL